MRVEGLWFSGRILGRPYILAYRHKDHQGMLLRTSSWDLYITVLNRNILTTDCFEFEIRLKAQSLYNMKSERRNCMLRIATEAPPKFSGGDLNLAASDLHSSLRIRSPLHRRPCSQSPAHPPAPVPRGRCLRTLWDPLQFTLGALKPQAPLNQRPPDPHLGI